VITHGTDTIEETAYFLRSVVPSVKPVVLTCAMRPASALSPDGPQNLLDALSVVMDDKACGVVVVCAGVVHAAEHVQKIHPYRLDAFNSGEAGPLAWTEEGRVRWSVGPIALALPDRDALSLPESGSWPQVEIVLNCVGANGKVVDALVTHGIQGLVVACTGNGTVSDALMASLLRAMSQGVKVVRATRCSLGRVVSIPDALIPDSQGLSPVKARVALMLSLMP
jgi:L-asparaginase